MKHFEYVIFSKQLDSNKMWLKRTELEKILIKILKCQYKNKMNATFHLVNDYFLHNVKRYLYFLRFCHLVTTLKSKLSPPFTALVSSPHLQFGAFLVSCWCDWIVSGLRSVNDTLPLYFSVTYDAFEVLWIPFF
jgi:hypothetical protein